MHSAAAMADSLAARQQALLARERPRLEALARRLVWDDEDARDVLQSALEDAVARWHTLSDPAAAPAWLRRIVVNRAMTHLRRRRFWNAIAGLLFVEAEPVADDASAAVERREHLASLAAALDALPARQSTAFTLRYLEGLSLDEVADALNIDRGTVRVHLQRAVRTLRERGVLPARDDASGKETP